MFERTEAIVFRISPYSNTSQISTWFSPDKGKINTLIKGALRPKSQFLGQYDMFYTCELVYYSKERNGIHIASECTPLNTRANLRSDWRASTAASYICDAVSRVNPPGSHSPELYRLTSDTLDFLNTSGVKTPIIYWFELKLLDVLGVAPLTSKCISCNRMIQLTDKSFFSVNRGGIICSPCVSTNGADRTKVIPADILAIMRNWQASNSPRSAFNTYCNPDQISDFSDILGIFLNFHLDLASISRNIALDLLNK